MSRRDLIWLSALVLFGGAVLLAGWWMNEQVDRAELLEAVTYGTFDEAKKVLDRGVQVDFRVTEGGCSGLYTAVARGDAALVRALLDHGADPSLPCLDPDDLQHASRGKTPLHIAVTILPEVVPDLVARGAPVDAVDAEGYTPLTHGMKIPYTSQLSPDTIAPLVENGADLNAVGEQSLVPLQLAIQSGNLPLVRYLWSQGARIPQTDDASLFGPITLAAISGKLELVKLVESFGYAVESAAGDVFVTRNPEVARYLLEHGADPNKPGAFGRTGIHWAHSLEVLRMVLEHGVEVSAADEFGNTPLHNLPSELWPEGGQLLLERGADVEAVNVRNETPLHKAAGRADANAVRVLLEYGADPDARNDVGATPAEMVPYEAFRGGLHWTGEDGSETLRLLREYRPHATSTPIRPADRDSP